MGKFKAIFFDMDGVLYDSMPIHEYTWVHSFCAHGITFEPEQAYINEGRTGKGTINLVFNQQFGRNATEREISQIYGLKTVLMQARPAAPVMPNMQKLVSDLRKKNIDIFVVTGSKQPSLLQKLSRDYGFDRQHIVSGADVEHGKPDPEPYLIALNRSGLSVDECAVVENAPMGVQSAKAANLFTFAINTGKLEDHYLTDEHCDLIFHDTAELAEALLKSV
ncbi:MAG: HAD family phosphatase [Bacteroidales bacterium]|nr:HAD family phosphatase [Bacteroidales bacterium]